jgi:preprotein translocase subunit YajC
VKVNLQILKKAILYLIFFLLGVSILLPMDTFAEDSSAKKKTSETNVDFSVKAIQPDTQVDKNISFFYPALQPGVNQELQLEISNKSDKELSLDIDLINATTGVNGNIDYNQMNAKLDESLDYPISDIAKVSDSTLTLKKNETKKITILITPKKEPFTGVKLGAIRVLKSLDKKKQAGIVTNYGYTIGLLVTEDKRDFNSGGDLVYKQTEAKIINGRKTASTVLQNPNPFVIQNLKMTSTLYKKGDKEVYGKKNLENMSIAPNSSFEFPIDLGLKNLDSGTYAVVVHGENDQNSWDWTKEFTVSQKDADQLNKDAIYKLMLPKIYYYCLIALVVFTILIFIAFFILGIQERKKEQNKKKVKVRKGGNKNV